MPPSLGQADTEKLQQAIAMHRAGQPARAAALYEDILRAHPRQFDATFFLGLAQAQHNNLDSAVQFFHQAAEINPAFVDAHLNGALASHSLGRLQEALEKYDRTLALKPGHARALYNRGLILSSLGRFDEA